MKNFRFAKLLFLFCPLSFPFENITKLIVETRITKYFRYFF